MLYTDFERIISNPRLHKYLVATGYNTRKAMTLYRANIRLTTDLFAIISLFEIALRNAIDSHHKKNLGNDWLRNAIRPLSGFLSTPGCQHSLDNARKVISKLAPHYKHDKAIAKLTLGFWTYQFASKEFTASGSTLLSILLARPFGVNHTKVFKKLMTINVARNRIAHHEPFCFATPIAISTQKAVETYQHITDLLEWLGIDPKSYLFATNKFPHEKRIIDKL